MSGDVTQFTNRITLEHKKPHFIAAVALACQPFADIKAQLLTYPALYDVDAAVGEQLDVVGQWAGTSRQLSQPITGVYFTLDTTGLGVDGGILQGPFDPATGITLLPDIYFRLVIKAKIVDNQWDGSTSMAYALMNSVFSTFGYSIFIVDNGDLTMYEGIIGPGAPIQIVQALFTSGKLDIKPAGIRVARYISQAVSGQMFALDFNNAQFSGLDSGFLANVIFN